jgi:hypothetical protein
MITAERAHELEERIEELQEEVDTLHAELQTAGQLEAERWGSPRASGERLEERNNWFTALARDYLSTSEISHLPNVDVTPGRVRQVASSDEYTPVPPTLQAYSTERKEEFDAWVAILRRDNLLSGHEIAGLPHVPCGPTSVNAIANQRIRDPGIHPASSADD